MAPKFTNEYSPSCRAENVLTQNECRNRGLCCDFLLGPSCQIAFSELTALPPKAGQLVGVLWGIALFHVSASFGINAQASSQNMIDQRCSPTAQICSGWAVEENLASSICNVSKVIDDFVACSGTQCLPDVEADVIAH